ncbi:MAG: MotA/TolQ/ExbB proton channel family protein [Deltaproteobacteria bacterium]|nr:MotA/TolQ/ExbB proton channel family protein [Deltaproteobacteria bacterium]
MNFTVMGLWHEMGILARGVVVVLIAMSIYSLGIAVERLLAYRKGKARSLGYIKALAPLMSQPGKLESARGMEDRFAGSPVARVVGTGIGEFAKGLEMRAAGNGDYDVIDGAVRAMERTKDRELASLRRGLPVLATVSSSAPFVGLFGTVGGIITAFQKLADPTKGGGGIGTVSAGIAEALVTTAVGLGVAIIAVWFYNYFTARVDDLIVDMDETASELVDSIIKDARATSRVAPSPSPSPSPSSTVRA